MRVSGVRGWKGSTRGQRRAPQAQLGSGAKTPVVRPKLCPTTHGAHCPIVSRHIPEAKSRLTLRYSSFAARSTLAAFAVAAACAAAAAALAASSMAFCAAAALAALAPPSGPPAAVRRRGGRADALAPTLAMSWRSRESTRNLVAAIVSKSPARVPQRGGGMGGKSKRGRSSKRVI